MVTLSALAEFTGTVSVVGSFCAGVHQFYLGYVFEGADGFSPMLLLAWLLGDLCNVIATFWTHQLAFQKVIACASTVNDMALAAQHLYYKRKHRPYLEQQLSPEPIPVGHNRFLAMKWNSLLRPYILFTLVSASRAAPLAARDAAEPDIDWEYLVGQCMAWVAELSYAFALIPQVLENIARKSTGSVSIVMFLADAVSSFNYLATILITADGKASHHKMVGFLLEELPYIFGTASCLVLDLVLLVQYLVYPQFVAHITTIDATVPPAGYLVADEHSALQPFRSWKTVRSYDSTDESRRSYI